MTEDESPLTRHFDRLLAEAKIDMTELRLRTGLNKNTITAVRRGRASDQSVAKVETVFSQILGTHVELGEDPPDSQTPGPRPSEISNEELLAELGYRITHLQRENDELREQLAQQPPPDTGVTRLDFNQARGGQRRYAANTGPDKMDDLEAPDDDPDDYP